MLPPPLDFQNCQLNKKVQISKSILLSSRASVHLLRYLLSFRAILLSFNISFLSES